MERTVKMQIDVPESFSLKLRRYVLDLQETGVKKTKAQVLVELAEQALLQRTVKHDIK